MVLPTKYTIHYRLVVSPNRPGVKVGSQARCWLCFPQVYRQQDGVRLLCTDPAEAFVAPNGLESDVLTGAAQRTVLS